MDLKETDREKKEEAENIQEGELQKIEEELDGSRQSFRIRKSWWLGLFLIFFLAVLPGALYLFSSSRAFFSGFLKRVPYPIVWVKGAGFVTSRGLLSDMEAVKIFYRSEDFAAQGLRIDFSTSDGKDRLKIKEKDLLDKLVEDEIVEALAKKKGITVTTEEADKDILDKVNQSGDNKTFALNLKQNYDWSINAFRDKVVIPQMYLKKLVVWYDQNDETAKKSKEEMLAVQKELDSKGGNFEELAKKYSEGESASSGGDLGWFKKEELVAEVAEKVYTMKNGEISDLIESPLGWHLVFLEDQRETEKDGQKIKEVKIKQIFLYGGSFLEWLAKEKNNFSVWIFVRDYVWDRDLSRIDFRNNSMRDRETDLRLKTEGDPSF